MHGSPECESSNAERQGQLDSDLPADVALDEPLQCFGDLAAFGRNPAIQFLGDFLGSMARPAFDRIESYDAQRLLVLAGEKILDHLNTSVSPSSVSRQAALARKSSGTR
jgi:hypothetical protein